ncbi:hypothetical protein F4W70_05615 [Pseudomonas cannabina]|nr:hypothetical protein F4W70_05615 [Pseudomonas cannabina]
MSAIGCVAALKSVTSDVPCVPVLLPVPGSSRTSEASPGLLPHKRSVCRSAPTQAKRRPVRSHTAKGCPVRYP